MTSKEMTAWVQLVGVALILGWLARDALTGGAAASATEIAVKMLWSVGALVAFNIVGTVLGTILVSILQREALENGPADERDHAVAARSLRNSGIATSILAALALVPLALGVDAKFAVYALFVAPVIGGTVNAVSELYYYRTM